MGQVHLIKAYQMKEKWFHFTKEVSLGAILN